MNDQNLVLWAIDENMGTNLQAFYKHLYISCLKTQKQQLHFVKIKINFFFFFFLNSGRAHVNRAGRKPVRAGRSALINRPSWNTAGTQLLDNLIVYSQMYLDVVGLLSFDSANLYFYMAVWNLLEAGRQLLPFIVAM